MCRGYYEYYPWLHSEEIQLNLSTMTTLETEESGRCREVLNKKYMYGFFVRGDEKSGRCIEVAINRGSTV